MMFLPYILALVFAIVNIFLCVSKITKKTGILWNIVFWLIVLGAFFVAHSSFANGDLMGFAVGFIVFDEFSFCFGVVLSVLILIFLTSSFYNDDLVYYKHEMLTLVSLVGLGLLLMSLSAELIFTLICLEIASIGLYAMIALNSTEYKSIESAFKYFLLSSLMSAFYLLGSAIIFGVSGTTRYALIDIQTDFLSLVGMILVLSMMFFKIGIFGFYRWSLDVYYGSSMNITGFFASVFKLASFTILIKFCFAYPSANLPILQGIFAFLAVLSMFAGNLLSIKENDVKKILIAASIVHSGYIFINLSAGEPSLYPALYYLCTYAIVTAFAFGILNGIFGDREIRIADLSGLYKNHPLEAFALTIICLSFVGFPYTVGFMGKLFVFSSAVEGGRIDLLIFGVINTILSVYYYLRIIISIYFGSDEVQLTCGRFKSLGLLSLLAVFFVILEGSGIFSIITALGLLPR
ncbi:NADH-quinone oxidoreductase subunit N [Helicobacter enhydrae]|uniref:NADH-quinone oxidoreductase subunit N n=1 Tax=Helicobacter enhydrae TaxID=222136 RepID=A0A1B1U597_9HELI|nr:proton-conducting transporter membrane subunit [Helicobacter enhydrae]ANV97928.1 NADH-quinone oxidoreductase subunit N [Helicobacter enhydrae]